jgi:hypothetical protein
MSLKDYSINDLMKEIEDRENVTVKLTLPAGKYWIGDPCYVLDVRDSETNGLEFDWNEFVNFCFDGDNSGRKNEGVVDHQNVRFAFHVTAHGDGCYYDQFDNQYGVDAGMIGCVPYDILATDGNDSELERLGTIHEFKNEFESSYDEGEIKFGHIEINTD